MFLRWAWGSSGSAKMLEAILLWRWGVVFSSVPREKLDSPPGGRNTLQINGQQITMLIDWRPATKVPLPTLQAKLEHVADTAPDTNQLHSAKKKKKKESIAKYKQWDASSRNLLNTPPQPFYAHAAITKRHRLAARSLLFKPRLSACQTVTISARQLTPVAYNHTVRWLVADSLQHGFLCGDTSRVESVPGGMVSPLLQE